MPAADVCLRRAGRRGKVQGALLVAASPVCSIHVEPIVTAALVVRAVAPLLLLLLLLLLLSLTVG